MDITNIDSIEPIPNIDHPSDGENVHYNHLIATLLYNILLELKVHTASLEQIDTNTVV